MSDQDSEKKESYFVKGFTPVSPRVNFPSLEEEVLKHWKDNKIFEKSIESKPKEKQWTFLDGPPFVTGMPHYGHLLGSIHKDIFGRYYTMKGYRVPRLWGWDGHGLPIENKVEGKLEITRKKDIEEKVGVKKFIEECKTYVEDISGEWEWYVDHIGRWVDFKNAYKTWDTNYMESVMWVFKNMYDKGHIYKGLRVTLYCPHCSTPISNFEVAMDADNYKETQDQGTTYKYEVVGEANTYILAWSTTPWNKIVTPALAVNPSITYVKVKQGGETYILAKSALAILESKGEYVILEEMEGRQLLGMKFIPHYDYYKDRAENGKKLFEVIGGDFVTADEGTGVVTIAAYGEEDLVVMKKDNVHIEMHVDEEGHIKEDVPQFGGMYYLKANKAVNEDLNSRGLIYLDETITHKVPLCWRCHTRLYYAPITAWYVNIQDLKPLLKKTNEEVNWFPKHFKTGRFLKSLENAPDWNISRNRYWGSPVPVWECECGERFVPGSIKELEERSGQSVSDLHKPEIDSITVDCRKCGKEVHRVPEVLDSWIEAGSASFAERHYPFDTTKRLEDFFPPDFIAEYTGQIRAWFYVLHVIGACLYESKAFKNVGVEGVILGTDGRKMSKNLGNYPDPKHLLSVYGGDALRLYLMGSPVMHGEDIIISEDQYKQQVRGMLLILWNVYNFYLTYAHIDRWKPNTADGSSTSTHVLDRWILSLLAGTVTAVTDSLEEFDTVTAIAKIQKFVTEFSTWYLRRSRDRVGPTAENTEDKHMFYQTTHEVFVVLCKLMAPITPFFAEALYTNLTDEESVHLADWPDTNRFVDTGLESEMDVARQLVEIAHGLRKKDGVRLRQPLSDYTVTTEKPLSDEVLDVIRDEVNVLSVTQNSGKELAGELNFTLTEELTDMGTARDLVRKIQEERKKIGTGMDEKVNVTLPDWPKSQEEYIKRQSLISNLQKSSEFSVSKV